MTNSGMRAPIVFMIFNRPDLTARVFAEIAKARPSKLLIVADGPRPGNGQDTERCAAARAAVEHVDWPCEVLRNYANENLGCARRPATGLQWAFEQVEEAVILEDDCLPRAGFFRYCDELLDRYRDDERVMHISGNQFVAPAAAPRFSYSFSRYCLSWGWATWRRAFRHYDIGIPLWPELRDSPWLSDLLGDPRAVEHWRRLFDLTFDNVANVNTWDFQWVFACWSQAGLGVLPSRNLVENIGFRADATHTKAAADRFAALATSDLPFPLRHPGYMIRDQVNDRLTFEMLVAPPASQGALERLRRKYGTALATSIPRSVASIRSRFAVRSVNR